MIKYGDTISSQTTGQPIYGAQVTVLNAQGLQATIYSDEAGTIPLSQPILTDQSGYFSFYIDDGRYNVVVMAGQAEIARTNITMVDTLGIKQRALLVPVNEDGGTIAPADARKGMVLAFDAVTGAPSAVLPNEFAGPTGPANSTYTSLAALKAAPQSNRSYILADGTNSPVTYAYVAGDFTGRADDVNVVKLDAVPLTTGALVRQGVDAIAKTDSPYRENLGTFLRRVPVTPEEYRCHVDDVDCTASMQDAMDAAAGEKRELSGQGRTYRWRTGSIPSNSIIRDLNAFVPADTQDNAPFFIDGQTATKTNIRIENCEVDGNRANQNNMISSGGDGQRAGVKIFGRAEDITLRDLRITHCATEGIFQWTGSRKPANADDILCRRLLIDNCDVRWSGRHGVSMTSHSDLTVRGGIYTQNGFDLPGATGPYTNGGFGRRLEGRLYGRGLTHEEFWIGEQGIRCRMEGVDARGNIGGFLGFRVMFPTKRSSSDWVVSNCKFDDPTGGNGDGSVILYAVQCPNDDGTGDRTVYHGADAWVRMSFNGVDPGRNYLNFANISNWSLSGRSEIDAATFAYNMLLRDSGPAGRLELSGPGTVLGYSTLFNISTSYGTWSNGSSSTRLLMPVVGGRHKVVHTITGTMPADTNTAFLGITVTPGYVIDDFSVATAATNNGDPLFGTLSQSDQNALTALIKSQGTAMQATLVVNITIKQAGQ